nr:hypothetical protein [Tanacetum cinerariifolium]
NIVANPKGELKAITTRSGLVVDGPTVPTHPPFINPEEDERVEETLTDPDLAEYTIKFPTPSVQKYKPSSQRDFVVHQRDPLHPNIPYPSRMLKQKQQEKDEFDIESDLKEIEYLLHHDPIKDIDSILKDLIDQSNLVDLNDNLVDSMLEMFTDEHALNYSSPQLYDEYDDDLFKVESDTENVYDDPFDSNGEKIKESKLDVDAMSMFNQFLFLKNLMSIR